MKTQHNGQHQNYKSGNFRLVMPDDWGVLAT